MIRTLALVVLLALLPQSVRAACLCERAGAPISCTELAEGDKFICGFKETSALQNGIVDLKLSLKKAEAEVASLDEKLKACTATKQACPIPAPCPPVPPETSVLPWLGVGLGVGAILGILLGVKVAG